MRYDIKRLFLFCYVVLFCFEQEKKLKTYSTSN